jgi:hypothetical protein
MTMIFIGAGFPGEEDIGGLVLVRPVTYLLPLNL